MPLGSVGPVTEFHPDLRRARFFPRNTVTPKTLPLMRLSMKLLDRKTTPAGVETLTLTSGVGVRLHRPPGASADVTGPALLWIHGGGYVIGSPTQDDVVCRRFAKQLGITVAAVKYRLSPENPYPASLEDCYSALTWLAALPSVDPTRVAIGGASAGGGLTAALALLARDRGEVEVAAQLLVYPMLDDRSGTRPGFDEPNRRLWSQSANRFGWKSYLGPADPKVAVPARRDDLDGLPPAWVGVGTLDLFHDEDLAYAERLRAAGVPCDVQVVDGAFHGFDTVMHKAPAVKAFFDAQVAFLRRALTQTESAKA
jgi:acetyl esterase/lipase